MKYSLGFALALSFSAAPALAESSPATSVWWPRAANANALEGYDELYPRYVEVCAETQQNRRGPGEDGTGGGHAIMFLKDACKDPKQPTLPISCGYTDEELRRGRMNGAGQLVPASELGLGVSTGWIMANSQYLLVPWKSLLTHGNQAPGTRSTLASYEAEKSFAADSGLMWGMEVHDDQDEKFKASSELSAAKDAYLALSRSGRSFESLSPTELATVRPYLLRLAASSLGTDFAVNFGRNSYCVRIPITESQTKAMIEYMRKDNAAYLYGGAKYPYQWDVMKHNCTHNTHNILAAAGIRKPVKTGFQGNGFFSGLVAKLKTVINIAIPSNDMVSSVKAGAEGNLNDVVAIFNNRLSRNAVTRFGWIDSTPGVLTEFFPARGRNPENGTDLKRADGNYENEVFKPLGKFIVLEGQLFKNRSKSLDRFMSTQEYNSIKADLEVMENGRDSYGQAVAAILRRGWPAKTRPSQVSLSADFLNQAATGADRLIDQVDADQRGEFRNFYRAYVEVVVRNQLLIEHGLEVLAR